ncbi:MAG: serine/threonine protein kinase [Planctomycetes bacterium]|nr:serine/threonine protein kinase [Planctomycetota bacterium]
MLEEEAVDDDDSWDLIGTSHVGPLFRSSPLTVGRRIGDYEILRELGRGGMGVVYLAHQISLQRDVAVKVLPGIHATSPMRREQFLGEARAAAKLRHPGIVTVYGITELDGIPVFSMSYVEGVDLGHLIDAARGECELPEGSLAQSLLPRVLDSRERIPWARRLVIRLARALQYAHDRGVIHRDVKPKNILIDEAHEPHLADFGLARDLDRDSLTDLGAQGGTLHYVSPERIAGAGVDAAPATDIYSLGVLLHELLTLEKPFRGKTPELVLEAIRSHESPSARSRVRGVSRDLDTIRAKALEKDPKHRYTSAAEFADDLEREERSLPIRARRPGAWQRMLRLARRHPAWVLSICVFGILLTIASLLWFRAAGTLRVTSSQDGASVYVDGTLHGVTPLELALSPGPHRVTLTWERTWTSESRLVNVERFGVSDVFVAIPDERPGQEIVDGELVDRDYRFRLNPPKGNWVLLDEPRARSSNSNAVASMIRVGGGAMVVIVEEGLPLSLLDYARIAAEASLVEDKLISSPRPLTFLGKSAFELSVQGTTRGVGVKYSLLVFAHQGFRYQILCQAIPSRLTEDLVDTMRSSFQLLDGVVRARAGRAHPPDDQGPGWRLRDGIYENSTHGFRWRTQTPWTIDAGVRVQEWNVGATLSLVREDPGVFVSLTVEPFAQLAPTGIEDLARKLEDATFTFVPDAPAWSMAIDGRLLSLRPCSLPADRSGVVWDAQVGHMVERDRLYRVICWYSRDEAARAEEALGSALLGFELLTDTERSLLETEFASHVDKTSDLTEQSVRLGRSFVNFEFGVGWTLPADGDWLFATQSMVIPGGYTLLMEAQEQRRGLTFDLVVDSSRRSVEDSHQHYLDLWNAGRESPILHGSNASSWYVYTLDGVKRRGRLVTLGMRNLSIHVSVTGLPGNVQQYEHVALHALEGLVTEGIPSEPATRSFLGYVDHRLKFELRRPGFGWSFRDNTPPEARGGGSMVSWRSSNGELSVVATGGARPGTFVAMTLMVDGIIQKNYPDHRDRRDIMETWRGQATHTTTLRTNEKHVIIRLLEHDSLRYLIMQVMRAGSTIDLMERCFYLID